MESKLGRPAEVLLVEDNEMDVVLTRKGFEKSRFAVNLHHVENGVKCMSFLRKQQGYDKVPTPDLVLLDLNMPEMNGREVLTEIVKDPELSKLPVIILTTSDLDRDLISMYKLRCNSYITKPVSFIDFKRLLEDLGNYWFTVVLLPPHI